MKALARSGGNVAVTLALLSSAACVHRQLSPGDAGQGADVGIELDGSAGSDAPADTAGERLTEADWQMMIAPRSGPHAVDDRNAGTACQPIAIGQEYLVQPTVGCTPTSMLDAQGNVIYQCTVQPYCTRHADCQDRRYGSCRGSAYAVCKYPGAERTPCTSNDDCRAIPGGSCPLDGQQITACYPTGRCEPPGRLCFYPDQQCADDADCTAVAGGRCAKTIVFPRCEYQPCMNDDGCDPDRRCLCDALYNSCVPADCHADAECGAGHECRLQDTCVNKAYHCSTDVDSCRSHADCTGFQRCLFKDARWRCDDVFCPNVP